MIFESTDDTGLSERIICTRLLEFEDLNQGENQRNEDEWNRGSWLGVISHIHTSQNAVSTSKKRENSRIWLWRIWNHYLFKMIILFDAQPVKCYSELTLISSGCRLSRVSTLSGEFWAFLKQSARPINFGHKGGLQSWNKRAFFDQLTPDGRKRGETCLFVRLNHNPTTSFIPFSRLFANKVWLVPRRKSEGACIDFATYYSYDLS